MKKRVEMSDSLLTAKDLSEMLGVSVRQVRRMQAAEKLPEAIYIGRLPRWRASEIIAWMDAGCPSRSERVRAKNVEGGPHE